MQEKLNGFKKVTQSYRNINFSTEIQNDGYVQVKGGGSFDIVPTLKVSGLVNGYGTQHPFEYTQQLYTWTHAATLYADSVGDDIKIYDGQSGSPDLNPFGRLFKDDFSSCVIWPLECRIYGSGFDENNFILADIGISGTHWMYDDSEAYIMSQSVASFQWYSWPYAGYTNFSYPFRAIESEIKATVNNISSSGTPLESDKTYNIMVTLACQKIDL